MDFISGYLRYFKVILKQWILMQNKIIIRIHFNKGQTCSYSQVVTVISNEVSKSKK